MSLQGITILLSVQVIYTFFAKSQLYCKERFSNSISIWRISIFFVHYKDIYHKFQEKEKWINNNYLLSHIFIIITEYYTVYFRYMIIIAIDNLAAMYV